MTEKKTAEEILKYLAFNIEPLDTDRVVKYEDAIAAMEEYAAQQSKMLPGSIAEGKVLMYGNIIVDSIMLPDGIYGTKLPRLYPSDETIEHMIGTGKMFRDKTGTEWLPDSYFDNLTKCELRDVVIVFQEQQSKIPTEEEMKKRQKDKGDYLREMGYPPQVITKYQDAIKETWEWLRNQIG